MNALVVQNTEYAVSDLERMARAFCASKLFGVQNVDQALALMLLAQAEGMHPATAARDYDIIQGRPSKKADAMLRDFIAGGGSVRWIELTNERAEATFTHPQGGQVTIDWDMSRARDAGLGGKDMWKKYPRQMLRARTVSEGVRSVFPGATSGMYVPEEVQDFGTARVVDDAPAEPKQTRAKAQPKAAEPSAMQQAAIAAIGECKTEEQLVAWGTANAEAIKAMDDAERVAIRSAYGSAMDALREAAPKTPEPDPFREEEQPQEPAQPDEPAGDAPEPMTAEQSASFLREAQAFIKRAMTEPQLRDWNTKNEAAIQRVLEADYQAIRSAWTARAEAIRAAGGRDITGGK